VGAGREARLKTYLEVRGADSGPLAMATALPALWRGLLYDDDASAQATALTARMSMAERIALRETVPREGLAAKLPWGETVLDAARRLVEIAREGLAREGDDASALAPLEEIAQTGRSSSDRIRDVWRDAKGDRSKLIDYLRIA
jgi:glutamate--cysteine ligase